MLSRILLQVLPGEGELRSRPAEAPPRLSGFLVYSPRDIVGALRRGCSSCSNCLDSFSWTER